MSGQSAAFDAPSTRPTGRTATETLARVADDYAALDRADESEGSFRIRDETSRQAQYRAQDRLIELLETVDRRRLTGAERVEYSILKQSLESRRDMRICRTERWDLNHITGWQIRLPPLAASAATATAEDRQRALRRWASVPAYIDADIGNLRTGLATGYAVPRTVVVRVLRQVDNLLSTAGNAEGPFNRPVGSSGDPEFELRWRMLVVDEIAPAIRRFEEFLRAEYLPHARESLGLRDLPHGRQCYAAFLRRETTLDVSAQDIFALGQATIERGRTELRLIGTQLFGTSQVAEVLERTRHASVNRFSSAEALVDYAREILARSTRMSRPFFLELPQQPIEIEPLPAYQQGTGISSHYEANDIGRTPVYRINLDGWQEQTRGAVAVTTVHEAVPRHHLQREAARSSPLPDSVARFAYNSAYVEGWANYVERLCEEIGVYDTPYSAIFRRSVLGQSLVLDPAVHDKRWRRERVRDYLKEVGENTQEADDLIDRIAVQPAQLTSYEMGGLEILRLREKAKRALGSAFDLRVFHQQVLSDGVLPLAALRERIEDWIRSAKPPGQPK